MKENNWNGFSLVEIILTIVIFFIFASGAVAVVLQGIDANRVGNEEIIASEYASEGMEAIRSIRNQSFSSLTSTTSAGVLRSGGGTWALSGTTDTFSKYTRSIAITDVQRDGSGNIVASGGTLDPNTRKVTVTVNWNINPVRSSSVVLTSYFTNWRATPASCTVYCSTLKNYTTGVCRLNSNQCRQNGETYESGGDIFCTTGSLDTCCCK